MVTRALWEAQPGCREKTATGKETTGDWRALFALEVPTCRDLALSVYRELLRAADWDGVNLAELYFDEPGKGERHPEGYTPFHPWVREAFTRDHGFDPIRLFQPGDPLWAGRNRQGLETFRAFRRNLLTQLHRELLQFLVAEAGGKDLVLTLVDDVLDPGVAEDIGLDTEAILGLPEARHFRIQVEDPYTVWSTDPRRYRRLEQAWGGRLKGRETPSPAFYFDLNVVDRERPNPTAKLGGAELARAVAAASGPGYVTLYSEFTIYPDDWPNVRAALASPARLEAAGKGLKVLAPRAVSFRPPAGWKWVRIDSVPAPVRAGDLFLVPPGEHLLEAGEEPASWLAEDTSCELEEVSQAGVRLYSPSRCYVILAPSRSGRPEEGLLLDGSSQPEVAARTTAGTVIRIPPGRHTLTRR